MHEGAVTVGPFNCNPRGFGNQTRFRQSDNANMLAIRRDEPARCDDFAYVPMRAGDVLLLRTNPETAEQLADYLTLGIPLTAVTFMPAMASLPVLWPVAPAAAP